MKRKSEYAVDFDSIYCPKHEQPIRGICTYPECNHNRFLCAQCRRIHPIDHQLHIEFIDEVFNLEYLCNTKLGHFVSKVQHRVKKKSILESKILSKVESYFDDVNEKISKVIQNVKNQVKAKIICVSNNNEEYHLLLLIKNLQEQLTNAILGLNLENIFNMNINEHLANYHKVDKITHKCGEMLKMPLIEFSKVSELLHKQLSELKMQILDKISELHESLQLYKPFQYYQNHISFDRCQEPGINISLRNSKSIYLFEYVPENQMILLGNLVGELKAFKLDTYESLISTKLEDGITSSINIPQRSEVFLAGQNGALSKISYQHKADLIHLEREEHNILTFEYIPEREIIAMSQANRVISFLDLETDMKLNEKFPLDSPCHAMSFISKMGRLFIGLADGSIQSCNLKDNSFDFKIQAYHEKISYITKSEDENMLISATVRGTITIWRILKSGHILKVKDIQTGDSLNRFIPLLSLNQFITQNNSNEFKVWSIEGRILKRKELGYKDELCYLVHMRDKSKLGVFINSGTLKFIG